MNKIILKTQATSKSVTTMSDSQELSTPPSLIAKPIVDNICDAVNAEEARYKAKMLYSEEIVIAWNLVSFALTKYATVT